MKMPSEVSQRHRRAALEYASKGFRAVGQNLLLLSIIILVQWLLRPSPPVYFLMICGLIMVTDVYNVLTHHIPLSIKRIISTCFGFIGFVLLLNYLYAFFGWLGIGATIIGTLFISSVVAGILIWKNKAEFIAASDMLASMINERRGKQ